MEEEIIKEFREELQYKKPKISTYIRSDKVETALKKALKKQREQLELERKENLSFQKG